MLTLCYYFVTHLALPDMKNEKEPVKIRFKDISDGRKSIYLDIYINGKRKYEFLKLYLLSDTRTNQAKNKETMRLANAVKSKRIVEIQNGRFGFDESSKIGFFDYFEKVMDDKAKNRAAGSLRIWKGALFMLRTYEHRTTIQLGEITKEWIEGFKTHLRTYVGNRTKRPLSKNTQHSYFSKLAIVLNRAELDGLITKNPIKQVESISGENVERMFLTIDEVKKLSATQCPSENTKRAFLFSCLTGLRLSDIIAVRWRDVEDGEHGCNIVFRQQKTKELEYMFISKQARQLMGERGEPSNRIFKLNANCTINDHLKKWMENAGINKRITFHCARHTFATMMLTLGNDLYTTSKLLGHKNITTTQIYAMIVDEKKRKAVESIPDII